MLTLNFSTNSLPFDPYFSLVAQQFKTSHLYQTKKTNFMKRYYFLTLLLGLIGSVPVVTVSATPLIEGQKTVDAAVNPVFEPDFNHIIYVDQNVDTQAPGYTGTGNSWANAVPALADVLNWTWQKYMSDDMDWDSDNPLKIYVAIGTYKPLFNASSTTLTSPDDRENAFLLAPNLQLYGGFDPTNNITELNDARIKPNNSLGQGTILSGDFLGNDEYDAVNGHNENAYRVMYVFWDMGVGLMDGFTITGGNSTDAPEDLIVMNTTIPSGNGGGIFSIIGKLAFKDCLFYNNRAVNGGALSSTLGLNLSFEGCNFLKNRASEKGGSIYNITGQYLFEAEGAILLESCDFEENTAEDLAGCIYNREGVITIQNSKIKNNQSDQSAGIYNEYGKLIINNSFFEANTSKNGSAIGNAYGTMNLQTSSFSHNQALEFGGAIYNYKSSVEISDCAFENNSAQQRGGAIMNRDSTTLTLTNGFFKANYGPQGAAIASESTLETKLINSVFTNNTGMMGGAILTGLEENFELIQCTLWGNTSSMFGGSGLIILQTPRVRVSNSIIWANSYTGEETVTEANISILDLTASSDMVITNSLIAGSGGSDAWDPSLGQNGGGNLELDPLFINPFMDDFQLQNCSPVINAGNHLLIPEDLLVDHLNNPRVMHNRVDMGAIEFQGQFSESGLAFDNDESTEVVGEVTYFYGEDQSCRLIAKVEPFGTNPLSGTVSTRVRVDSELPTYQNTPYVQRHYLINTNDTGSAWITLYYTQAEFDSFNNAILSGFLPMNPTDVGSKMNIRIYQFHGEDGSSPADFEGDDLTVVKPEPENIIWDDVNQRWEIRFWVEQFSGFFLGSVSTPLPVNLISFDGAVDTENQVALTWEVTEQQNIVKYAIEFSPNGRNFEKVGSVTATKTSQAFYHFRHTPNAYSPVAYYRLNIIENDNTHTYSDIIGVAIKVKQLITAYPVPADQGFWLEGKALTGTSAKLVNQNGAVLKTWQINHDKSYVTMDHFPSGLYWLQLENGEIIKVLKK